MNASSVTSSGGFPSTDIQHFFSSGPSGVFEALYRQVNKQVLAPFLKTCLDVDGVILDAGCGWGDLASHLNLNHLCGVDVAFEPLMKGRRLGAIGPCAQGDLAHLPFESETFDTIICANVLHYTGFSGLQELYRVTKTNGRMLLAFLERSSYTRCSIDLAISLGVFPEFMREVPLFDISDFHRVGVTIEDSVTVIGIPPWFMISRDVSRKGLVVYVLRKTPLDSPLATQNICLPQPSVPIRQQIQNQH